MLGSRVEYWLWKLARGKQASLVSLTQGISLPSSTFSKAVISLDFKQLPLILAQPRQLSDSRTTDLQAAGSRWGSRVSSLPGPQGPSHPQTTLPGPQGPSSKSGERQQTGGTSPKQDLSGRIRAKKFSPGAQPVYLAC